MKRFLRKISLFIVLVLLILLLRPSIFLLVAYCKDGTPSYTARAGYTNDASRMNETKLRRVELQKDSAAAVLQIITLLQQAKTAGKKISIAGAKHSMGGHTISADGIMLNMANLNYMQLDSKRNIVRVGSGTLWSDLVTYLDRHGKSVLVMQSNNSFSVGGSVSVNCHGWQANHPPIAATVESLRLIDANGQLLQCSSTQNAELFSLVLGGYGLFGVITDIDLRITDNKMYTISNKKIKSENYVAAFDNFVGPHHKGMAYGRINVTKDHFMDEAVITKFTEAGNKVVKPLAAPRFQKLRRTVFRASAGSDYGKNLRWDAEQFSNWLINGKTVSRNQLQNEGVEVFENTKPGYTDILQEYFIPRNAVPAFLKGAKKLIPATKVDLLNITVRDVAKDSSSLLAYAKEDMFGFVMLYNQATDSAAEKEMQSLTRQLIDLALDCGGTYYLPYRLHATPEQFRKAYPNANRFFELKIQYDSAEIFQNKFYQQYH